MGIEKKLNGEYLDSYKSVVRELELEAINGLTTQEVKNDVLDMFLSAQENNVPPKSIVGNSVDEFVKNIIMNVGKSSSILFRICRIISLSIGMIGGICLVEVKNGTLNFTIDMIFLVIILIIGDILGRILSKKFQFGKNRKVRKNIIEVSFAILGIVGLSFVRGFINLPVLFVINSPYIFIIGCCIIGFISFMAVDILIK